MANASFSTISNPRKIVSALAGIIDQSAIDSIELEIRRHSQMMFDLSLKHFRVADRLGSPDWRQKVSRAYYASYNSSKMLRYFIEGYHSKEVSDHKKIGDIPTDFPQRSIFSNRLQIMREDRNLCDYDHDAHAIDLSIGVSESVDLSRSFMRSCKAYVGDRGFLLRGRI